MRYSFIEAPSILGLKPTGVEYLPRALKNAGLVEGIGAVNAGTVFPPSYDPHRDEDTSVLNAKSIAEFTRRLANKVKEVMDRSEFPVVLGGDCSILLGDMLELKRRGRFGLFFIDGHADFYQPEASPTGEAADMDLALVSGRGPALLTNIDRLGPYVKDEDVVVFGQRDQEDTRRYGSQEVRETGMHVFDLQTIRALGIEETARKALAALSKAPIEGFWIHLDADVLCDEQMPAVDYRMKDGLTLDELARTLHIVLSSKKAVGMNVTVYNPLLDPGGRHGKRFTDTLVDALKSYH